MGLIDGPAGQPHHVERLAVVARRFVVGQLGQGEVPGPGRVTDRFAHLGGGSEAAGEMMGEGGQLVVEVSGVQFFDDLTHVAVEGDPAGTGELVVERGTHQGVSEAVTRPGDLGEETGGARLLQR